MSPDARGPQKSSRRYFVTSLAALPAAAAGASVMLRPNELSAQTADQLANDPVFVEFVTQMQRAGKDLSEGKHREGVRALEMLARFQAAHGRQQKQDDGVKRDLRKTMRARGRQALLNEARAALEAQIRELKRSSGKASISLEGRLQSDVFLEGVIDKLQATGFTPFLVAYADALERLERNHHKGVVTPALRPSLSPPPMPSKVARIVQAAQRTGVITRVRDDYGKPYCSDCEYLSDTSDHLAAAAAIICLTGNVPACIGATAGWLYAWHVYHETCDGGCQEGRGPI
jgi:hypothetical protein